MSDITPDIAISREHDLMRNLMYALQGMAHRLDAAEPVDPKDLERACLMVQMYGETIHHTKEEDVIFPALTEDRNIAEHHKKDIARMRGEHRLSELSIRGISRLLPLLEKPALAEEERKSLTDSIRVYTDFMLNHLREEDRHMIPLLRELPPAGAGLVMLGLNEIDRDDVGVVKHEILVHEARSLRDKYRFEGLVMEAEAADPPRSEHIL